MIWQGEAMRLFREGRGDPAVAVVAGKLTAFLLESVEPGSMRTLQRYGDVAQLADRCLTLLESDLEYPWPRPDWPSTLMVGMAGATLIVLVSIWAFPSCLSSPLMLVPSGGLVAGWVTFALMMRAHRRRYAAAGDQSAWPFLSMADYQAALRAQEEKP
jgi:hypothetical protein